MARAFRWLRRIKAGTIYHILKADTNEGTLCSQQSICCVPVHSTKDSGCSILDEMNEIIQEEKKRVVDVLKAMLDELLSERPATCAKYRTSSHGRRAAGRILLLSNREERLGKRLWYALDRTERNAQWYREGPPNNWKFAVLQLLLR